MYVTLTFLLLKKKLYKLEISCNFFTYNEIVVIYFNIGVSYLEYVFLRKPSPVCDIDIFEKYLKIRENGMGNLDNLLCMAYNWFPLEG